MCFYLRGNEHFIQGDTYLTKRTKSSRFGCGLLEGLLRYISIEMMLDYLWSSEERWCILCVWPRVVILQSSQNKPKSEHYKEIFSRKVLWLFEDLYTFSISDINVLGFELLSSLSVMREYFFIVTILLSVPFLKIFWKENVLNKCFLFIFLNLICLFLICGSGWSLLLRRLLSSCGELGRPSHVVHGFLTAVSSIVAGQTL